MTEHAQPGPIDDPHLRACIEALHATDRAQEAETSRYFRGRARKRNLSWDQLDEQANGFMADKLVALEPIKADFAYMLCRALRARRVVEIGTSFGVSTHYLAAAVRDNGGGVVIATEYEASKAVQARANFTIAGISELIDLREGDLRQTLRTIDGEIDFVLMDVWPEMSRPALELLHPRLRTGAVILADNTQQFRHAYRHFFDFVADEAHGLKTLTLPFAGGMDLIVKT
jgi:predicted O-methyltransferase YrrM